MLDKDLFYLTLITTMETLIKRRKRDFSQIQNDWIVSKELSDAAFRLLCYIEMQADSRKFYKEEIKKRF